MCCWQPPWEPSLWAPELESKIDGCRLSSAAPSIDSRRTLVPVRCGSTAGAAPQKRAGASRIVLHRVRSLTRWDAKASEMQRSADGGFRERGSA